MKKLMVLGESHYAFPVIKAAKKLNIDGIMSFACNPSVITAAYVAEQMGLPNVGSYVNQFAFYKTKANSANI